MSREQLKKKGERIFVDLFLKHRKLLAATCRDQERPDFLIDVDGQTVGIEVTQLFKDGANQTNGSKLKADESIRAKSISKLAKRYYDASHPPRDW